MTRHTDNVPVVVVVVVVIVVVVVVSLPKIQARTVDRSCSSLAGLLSPFALFDCFLTWSASTVVLVLVDIRVHVYTDAREGTGEMNGDRAKRQIALIENALRQLREVVS